jgi:pyruvate-ferredoxin/flavodoxin oxidoreductase
MTDANDLFAQVADPAQEVTAIYPITLASALDEYGDFWSANGRSYLFDAMPVEMQPGGGAAGAVQSALQDGAGLVLAWAAPS